MVPAIHAITTRGILARPDFLSTARRIMQALGPRGALHIRVEGGGRRLVDAPPPAGPTPSTRGILELAEALVVEQERSGALLVINDRIDLAIIAGAGAVQLPSHGLTARDARAVADAAHRVVRRGLSVHTVDEVRAASTTGASWVIAGAVYATPSHPEAHLLGLDGLRSLCAASTIPVIAIGGVRPADVGALRAAGAAGVAIVSGIWSGPAADHACLEYLSQL